MYKEMHGVFEVIEDAIDAAYEAQRILEANYTTEDRQKFIDAVKAEALKVVNEETIKEFEETGYGRLDQKLVKNYGSIAENPGVESPSRRPNSPTSLTTSSIRRARKATPARASPSTSPLPTAPLAL